MERDELSITYKNLDRARWLEHLETIAIGNRTALELAQVMAVKTFDKFDDVLTEELLDAANACDRLDLPNVKQRSVDTLRLIS